MDNETVIVIKAKYLITSPGCCVVNGAVAIKGTMIYRTGTFDEIKVLTGIGKTIDLGNAVILPGLINVHTHLDLTNLHNRIKPTNNFTHWVFQLVGARLRWGDEDYISSIGKGVCLCIESGTTTVADISNTGHAFAVLKKSPLRKVVYKEVIGMNPDRVEDIIKRIQAELSAINPDDLLSIGLSPHAPYSVSSELYRAVSKYAKATNMPVCTHIAETQDEIEFLTKGTGNFPALLRQLRAITDRWKPPGVTPVNYLSETGILHNRFLLIHCNYVTDEEISRIKTSGASIVFCPRSHHFFGHTNHPVQRFLNEGINVGLGTDSLASNDTLSILDEMKFLVHHYALSPQVILSMATVNGAKAIGLESQIGQIREGFEADICGVRLQDGSAKSDMAGEGAKVDVNVYNQLFNAASKNVFTMVAGVVCYDALLS